MNQCPSVSVIVPTYNRGELLCEHAASVLAQGDASFELIYVDDGSTDDTPQVLKECREMDSTRVQVIRVENGGPGPARNAGVAAAKGDMLLFTDDDVLVPENWIQGMLARFEALDCDALCGDFRPFALDTAAERYLYARMRIPFGEKPHTVRGAPMMNFLIPRALFIEVGGFLNEPLQAAEDWEFCQRLNAANKSVMFDPSNAVTHRYASDMDGVAQRIRATGALGVYINQKQGHSLSAYVAYSTLRFLLCPLTLPRHYPSSLYLFALRMERMFIAARIRAYLLLVTGKSIPLSY